MKTPMATTPPINPKPEPKHYMWMGIVSLVFVVLALFLPQRVLPFSAGLFLLVLAFILALISLKMRRKTFPIIVIIVILVSAIPLCCVGGSSAFLWGVDILQGNNPVFAPKPKVEWDTAPTAIIAQAVHPIRHYQPSISSDYTRNYIPEARLWGDGRILWASYGDSGGPRTVMEGQLTPEQMTVLLKQFVDAGFFGWNNNYFSLLPYDNPPTDYLTINLLTAQKTVIVSMGNPPRAFNSLFATLNSGAGAQGKIFKPTQGTLIAIPITTQTAEYNWDHENLNLDLSKAAEGIPVEGKALQLAWDVVNKNPYYPPPVSLNGVTYTIYVIIPGMMYY
jgi:hypothetical protein